MRLLVVVLVVVIGFLAYKAFFEPRPVPQVAVAVPTAAVQPPTLTDCGGGVLVEPGVSCPETSGSNQETSRSDDAEDDVGPAFEVTDSGGGSVTIDDGHYDSGAKTVSLSDDQAIVGQSYGVNGETGGCQVFGGNGPATVKVVDGEWWVFDAPLSPDDMQSLMAFAEQNQQSDPNAQCSGGSHRVQI